MENRVPRAGLSEKLTSEQGLEEKKDHSRTDVGVPESKYTLGWPSCESIRPARASSPAE